MRTQIRTTWRASFNRALEVSITAMLVAGVFMVFGMAGCSPPGIKGDGVIVTTNRPISDFSELVVNGAYKIKWTSGKPSLTVSTDQNLLALVETTLSGSTLEINWEKTLRPTKGITINLSSASLAEVRLNGAVSLTGSKFAGHSLKLESNGA